jgi:hypothetical protein
VAVLEILIGVLVAMGVLTRPAAAIGLALNLVLFLTASWHTVPYFLGSDIVFVFAWLPFVLAGAEGQPTAAALLARRPPGLRRARGPGRILTRRALLAQALGLAGLVTAAAATASTLAPAPIERRPGHARLERRVTSGPPPRSRPATRRRTQIRAPVRTRSCSGDRTATSTRSARCAPTPAAGSSTTAMRSPARATTRPSTSAAGHRSAARHEGRWPLPGSPSATAASWRAR